jgi:hypothetical protein
MFKTCVPACVLIACAFVAPVAFDGSVAASRVYAQATPADDPKFEEKQDDRRYLVAAMREYMRAPDRIWTFPEQVSVMLRHADDMYAWCDWREAHYGYNNKETVMHPADLRIKDEIRRVRAYLGVFKAKVPDFVKEFPERFEKVIAAADEQTQKGTDAGSAVEFDKGRRSLDRAREMVLLAEVLYADDEAGLARIKEDYKKLTDRIAARQKTYLEKTRSKTKAPTDRYTASDAEEIKQKAQAAWKAKYPDDKPADVYLASTTLARINRATWNPEKKRVNLDDVSMQPVSVVVNAEPGWQWVYTMMVERSGPSATPVLTAVVPDKENLINPTEMMKAR